jgi:DNA-binding CsgD family transcriptional regulator
MTDCQLPPRRNTSDPLPHQGSGAADSRVHSDLRLGRHPSNVVAPCADPVESGSSAALMAEAIETIGLGIVLVAADGFIIFANRVARELIDRSEGLRSSSGWLAGTTPGTTEKLRALIKGQSCSAAVAKEMAAVLLDRGEGRRPLLVQVNGIRDSVSQWGVGAVVSIVDLAPYSPASFDTFATSHRLTVAETRVLRQVVAGKSLTAAAQDLHISEPTARTHMSRVLDKTGTKRQTELLYLFFNSKLTGHRAGSIAD